MVAEGEGTVINTEKAFTFIVNLYDAAAESNKTELKGAYAYSIDGAPAGELTSGGTIVLKHGQTAVISELPDGAGYVITESDEAGYTPNHKTQTGTVSGNASAAFVNTYSVDGNPASVNIEAVKILTYFGQVNEDKKAEDGQVCL